jgi:hypothetical protein
MQSKDLGSPINAATECFADTDQKLLNYRLGMPFNAGRSERAKLVCQLVVRAFGAHCQSATWWRMQVAV